MGIDPSTMGSLLDQLEYVIVTLRSKARSSVRSTSTMSVLARSTQPNRPLRKRTTLIDSLVAEHLVLLDGDLVESGPGIRAASSCVATTCHWRRRSSRPIRSSPAAHARSARRLAACRHRPRCGRRQPDVARRSLWLGPKSPSLDLLGAFVADSAAQIALFGGVEPDRDQDCAMRRRRLHQLRIRKRSSVARSAIAARASAFAARSAAACAFSQQRTSAWSSSPSSRRIR